MAQIEEKKKLGWGFEVKLFWCYLNFFISQHDSMYVLIFLMYMIYIDYDVCV